MTNAELAAKLSENPDREADMDAIEEILHPRPPIVPHVYGLPGNEMSDVLNRQAEAMMPAMWERFTQATNNIVASQIAENYPGPIFPMELPKP